MGDLLDHRAYTGYTVNPTLGLVIPGGQGPSYYTWTVDATLDGSTFTSLPRLPEASKYGCAASVDDNTIVALGSSSNGLGKLFKFKAGKK